MHKANIDKKISLSDLNRPKDYIEVIEKYPFATDANAADVGDLTHTRERLAGQQV